MTVRVMGFVTVTVSSGVSSHTVSVSVTVAVAVSVAVFVTVSVVKVGAGDGACDSPRDRPQKKNPTAMPIVSNAIIPFRTTRLRLSAGVMELAGGGGSFVPATRSTMGAGMARTVDGCPSCSVASRARRVQGRMSPQPILTLVAKKSWRCNRGLKEQVPAGVAQ